MNKVIIFLLSLSYLCIGQATTFIYKSDDCDSVSDVMKQIVIEIDTSKVKKPFDENKPIFKSAQEISFAVPPNFKEGITSDNCGAYDPNSSQRILLGGPGGKALTMTQIRVVAPYDKDKQQCGVYDLAIFIHEPRCIIILKQQ